MIVGASFMLSTIERVLKLAVTKWTDFAVHSKDCAEITHESVVLPNFLGDRPLSFIRRWNTVIALQYALDRIGRSLGVDAFEWQQYIMEQFQGGNDALEEHLLSELNDLASLEFMAKVYARGELERGKKSPLQETQDLTNSRIGWGARAAQ
jgi:hypothetical protein